LSRFSIPWRAPLIRARGVRREYPLLRLAVAIIWALFLVFSFYSLVEESPTAVAGAIAIATAALLPGYLWADGLVPGLPVLPLHTLALLWAFALPLVAGHPEARNYDDAEVAYAAACVVLYAIVSTLCWIAIGKRPVAAGRLFRVLPRERGFALFIVAIFAGSVFTMLSILNMIYLGPGLYGILRSVVLSFASIAMFVLSLRLGAGELSAFQRLLFLAAAVVFVIAQTVTLYLIGSIITIASALIGFTIGRGRVPWATIMAVMVVFGFLHNGKAAMREQYWEGQDMSIKFGDLPQFFTDWVAAAADEIGSGREGTGKIPIYERVSLMHLLLMAQRNTPDFVPFLKGETYTLIPALLVPRILSPDKPDSHEGTAILNQQFGLQSLEDTQSTTVAWGLLNEGYANFGVAGVAGVAAFLGLLFGFAGRLSAGAPVMSLATMVGVTFCAIAIETEFTMGVFATVLFQSLVVLTTLLPFLKLQRAEDAA
jgi:hypothetical protein